MVTAPGGQSSEPQLCRAEGCSQLWSCCHCPCMVLHSNTHPLPSLEYPQTPKCCWSLLEKLRQKEPQAV